MMKRLICAAMALSLMGTTAASARSWNRGNHYDSHRTHYSAGHHGWNGNRHGGDNGAGIALGIGLALFAVAAIASTSNDGYDRYDRYDYSVPPPPPPPPAYYGGYGPYGY